MKKSVEQLLGEILVELKQINGRAEAESTARNPTHQIVINSAGHETEDAIAAARTWQRDDTGRWLGGVD